MDLNFFLGMDRKTFERGLRPIPEGYLPNKNDIIIYGYVHSKNLNKKTYERFFIFTDFEDGTTTEGWGIFYDVYDFKFYKSKGGGVLGGSDGTENFYRELFRRAEKHDYQWPNTYENWLQLNTSYIWKGNDNFYLNWNENPFEVKQ